MFDLGNGGRTYMLQLGFIVIKESVMDIDDYNADYFDLLEDDWEDYQDLLEEDFDRAYEQEQDYTYNIFTLLQSISVLKEVSKSITTLGEVALSASDALQGFIDRYSEYYGEKDEKCL